MSKVETDNTAEEEKAYQNNDIRSSMKNTISYAYVTNVWENVAKVATLSGIIASIGLLIVKGCKNE